MLRRLLPGVYEGWIVVGSAAFVVLLIGATFFYGFGVFFSDIVDEFGWSVAITSLAFSLRSEVGGVAAPFVGALIDRMGVRRVLLAGVVLSALGVLLMSLIQNVWQFYLAMVVIALGTSASGGQAGLVAVATWFDRRRAMAMSWMTLGGGLGGLLVVAIAALVEEFGWRAALRILAAAMLTGGSLVALNVRSRPADHPQPLDGIRQHGEQATARPALRWGAPVARAIRARAFIATSLAMVAASFATTAVAVLQVPYLEHDIGVSKAVAGVNVAIYTTASIAGRLGFGLLGDRVSKRVLLSASALMVVSGLPILALAHSYTQATLGILLIAPGFGGSIPIRPAMFADYFGTRSFGTINGLAALVNTTGGAAGPWVVGRLVDVTGHYRAGWLTAAVVALAAVPLYLLAAPPRALMERYRAEAEAAAPGEPAVLPTH